MWSGVERALLRPTGELTIARWIDWVRDVRKNESHQRLMNAISTLVGPVIRCNYCGTRGGVMQFDREDSEWIWRCRCCRHAGNGRSY